MTVHVNTGTLLASDDALPPVFAPRLISLVAVRALQHSARLRMYVSNADIVWYGEIRARIHECVARCNCSLVDNGEQCNQSTTSGEIPAPHTCKTD